MTEIKPIRVLLAGMQTKENQFSRVLGRYMNVKVEWTNPDPDTAFPTDCDALVVAKCQISHAKFWRVKDSYKGKPLFIADHSFSTIKENFEKFLDGRPQVTITPEDEMPDYEPTPKNTQFADALTKAGVVPPRIQAPYGGVANLIRQGLSAGHSAEQIHAEIKKLNWTKRDGTDYRLEDVMNNITSTKQTDRQKAKRKLPELLAECFEANLTVDETLEMLKHEGIERAPRGGKIDRFFIYARKKKWKEKQKGEIVAETPPPVTALSRPVPPPAEVITQPVTPASVTQTTAPEPRKAGLSVEDIITLAKSDIPEELKKKLIEGGMK